MISGVRLLTCGTMSRVCSQEISDARAARIAGSCAATCRQPELDERRLEGFLEAHLGRHSASSRALTAS
jgi:hypothetical protein